MKLVELLERDKENLLTELAAAKEPDRAIRVLENELDKLLMTYNEQADSERERDAAAYMMQAVRLSLPLVDSVGETKVWETGSVVEEHKTRIWPLVIILLIVAIVLCGVGLLPLVMDLGGIEKVDYVKQGPMLLGGLAAAFVRRTLIRTRSTSVSATPCWRWIRIWKRSSPCSAGRSVKRRERSTVTLCPILNWTFSQIS